MLDSLFISFQAAVAGRYSLDREIGRGGSGIVYLAREVHLDRLVAIKLLPPDKASDATLRDRFLREARLAAKLSHPNIIPIHAVEDAGGFVFFVMAYIDGETLASRVRTRGPLSAGEGTRTLREVAWALAYAHGQGLVHRDVKPDNILIESGTGRVFVADFGIASVAGDGAGGPVSGTPEFMSPEAVLGSDIDARADLYALGVTAYYAFSGRLPFEGSTAIEVLGKQVTETAPPLASLGLTVPRKLAALVDHCLAKAPNDRPASANVLAEKLATAIAQRREFPAALRSFVKRARLNGGGTLLGSIGVLWGSVGVAALTHSMSIGFTTFSTLAVGAPLGYMVYAARKLMRGGFVHRDLAPAYKQEIEQTVEELTTDKPVIRTPIERVAAPIAKISAATFAVSLAVRLTTMVMLLGDTRTNYFLWRWSEPVMFISLGLATVFAVVYLQAVQQRRDVDTDFWAKVWLGRLGRLAFKIASKLVGTQPQGSAMTHRATELSLGLAAEQLFESLPKETRRELAELPDVLRRLQDDARTLRQRHDEISEALSGSAPTSSEFAKARDLRDELHARLGQTVGTLETIRLNLLRLHAGAATIEGLTTHLGIAAEVSEAVGRLVQAHEEVDRTLKFPRSIAPSPA